MHIFKIGDRVDVHSRLPGDYVFFFERGRVADIDEAISLILVEFDRPQIDTYDRVPTYGETDTRRWVSLDRVRPLCILDQIVEAT